MDRERFGEEPVYLIVNADDYAYFPCVSRGILAVARAGIVTATGVLANAPRLDEQLGWLDSVDLDVGVHLNLTSGRPVAPAMRDRLRRWDGLFPGKEIMAGAILTGILSIATVEEEWNSQIESCRKRGVNLRFLNSHEHIHMLPPLFTVAKKLAKQHGIEHVRYTLGGVPRRGTVGAITRSLIIHCLGLLNRRQRAGTIPCLGLGESGRLSVRHLDNMLPSLRRGGVYELMCHPGYLDRAEISDRRLLLYHDWEQELDVLTSGEVRGLLARHGVSIVGYRDLPVANEKHRLTAGIRIRDRATEPRH